MRIVNLATFLAMPSPVFYHKYEPCIASSLEIKRDNCGDNDWFLEYIGGTECVSGSSSEDTVNNCMAMEAGASKPAEYGGTGRGGCYNDGQLFLVYEKDDVDRLIAHLQAARKDMR